MRYEAKSNNVVAWNRIDEHKDSRPGSVRALIVNYQPGDLIRHITTNPGIHILQGDAGWKNPTTDNAYSLWDPPHLTLQESILL